MLVGSRALTHWIPEYSKFSKNSDWDYIGEAAMQHSRRCEVSPISDLNNERALQYNVNGVCSLKGLALIKRSHLHRDRNFDKHITMYHKWILPNLDEDFTPDDIDFLKERARLTKKAYPAGNPNLNQSNEDFFDDAVDKKYDHDWLHELYAYGDEPVYMKMKVDKSKAWCEKDMWENLPTLQKLQCVSEETYVIATERFLVPSDYKVPAKLAYIKSLKKVCTTLTSGWFRDYAIDNYPTVINMYDQNMIDNVKVKLI